MKTAHIIFKMHNQAFGLIRVADVRYGSDFKKDEGD